MEQRSCLNVGLSNIDWGPDDSLFVHHDPRLTEAIKFRKKVIQNAFDWEKFNRRISNPIYESSI